MITENLSTLKIHKLTKEQYSRKLANGTLDDNAFYLTPDETDFKIGVLHDELDAHTHIAADITDVEWMATIEIGNVGIVLPETTLTMGSSTMVSGFQFSMQLGIEYDVYWNGVCYACTAYDEDGAITLDSDAFTIYNYGGTSSFVTNKAGSGTVTIQITTHAEPIYNTLPEEFIPDTIARIEDIESTYETIANVQTQINETKTYVDTVASGKANTSHGNHVPETQTADNATFLRNDNTWQKVTPANIGAATSTHTHTASDVGTYSKSEIDNMELITVDDIDAICGIST